ncbi:MULTISPECIES: hypothetical protein [unclassified Breznakia]|uniref:hypothetical protein n=1 Tax=unclassified Breznakia TaxID=2623764 RepID=UPI0024734AC3|nr:MULTISPECIES: hypothetical protein [unclassified Breznakia]MDH6367986.1 hypothetical protein [Breznakia sp. PH1-1]MDH6405083.1 hypothetical protein [Breznakia sp. PF1-11]MDH6412789.1 hypothetical protein [Breznakia sp. PFB1-11]MDH6415158.1 hypothetical protein [Breznakia sp. PFB1-14]MDH6417469.1 hypothetical protein [Breznakia sp. PFB1-4]
MSNYDVTRLKGKAKEIADLLIDYESENINAPTRKESAARYIKRQIDQAIADVEKSEEEK